jgi:3-keto-5-aminohexanoate cleavage enzyme
MKPVIIEVGLNEATTRKENPHVPITPEEIADDIVACAEAGATIIHFHARDPETGDQRTCDTALYREAMLRVREAGCDILMYPTYAPFLSGNVDPVQERFGHVLSLADDPEIGLRIGPLDMGSLNLVMAARGELLPGADSMPLEFSVYQNPVPLLRRMLEQYDSREMISTLAVFEPGHLRLTMILLAAGLGRNASLKFMLSDRWMHGPLPDPEGLDDYLRLLDRLRGNRQIEWVCAPSGIESPAALEELLRHALQRDGHVRVGVGDCPVAADERTNAQLVAEVVTMARAAGREPASAGDALRQLTGRTRTSDAGRISAKKVTLIP